MEPQEPNFSEGMDRDRLMAETEALLENGWALSDDRAGVEKTFPFPQYTKAMDFSQVIGVRSKSKNHHSKMLLEARSVWILWTTHNPPGLSDKDLFMARYCDEQAGLINPRPDPSPKA